MKKKKLLFPIVSFLIGAISGFMFGPFLNKWYIQVLPHSPGEWVQFFLFIILELLFAFLLQVILHESGHLIGGLLSGYRFLSFRIGKLMWKRDTDGKLKFCLYSLAGTAGQCLMCPPDRASEDTPVILYNMGGSLINLASVLPFLILDRIMPFGNTFFVMAAFVGLLSALCNGIPFKTNTINNDGCNTLEICRNPKSRHAFLIQMKIAALVSSGIRLRDMPEEYFQMPSDEDMGNGLISTLAVFRQNRLMDQLQFEEAEALTRRLLNEPGVLGLYKSLLTCDLVCLILLGQKEKEEARQLLTKEQRTFMRQMKAFLSVIRTEYICSLLLDQDEQKAGSYLEAFEKAAQKWPHPAEIDNEKELMELGKAFWNGCQGNLPEK